MSEFMQLAFEEAERAGQQGEVPVGAVLVSARGDVLSHSGNLTERLSDPTAHAELIVIREAAKQKRSPRLIDCDLYVTLEPCAMCAAAISLARIRRLYFAAYDPKAGGVDHGPRFFEQPTCLHRPEVVGGIDEQKAAHLLKAFFQERR